MVWLRHLRSLDTANQSYAEGHETFGLHSSASYENLSSLQVTSSACSSCIVATFTLREEGDHSPAPFSILEASFFFIVFSTFAQVSFSVTMRLHTSF